MAINVGQEIQRALDAKQQAEAAKKQAQRATEILTEKDRCLESLGQITWGMFDLPPESVTRLFLESQGMVAELGYGWDFEIERSETESDGRVRVLFLEPFGYWLVFRPSQVCYESLWEGFSATGTASIPQIARSLMS